MVSPISFCVVLVGGCTCTVRICTHAIGHVTSLLSCILWCVLFCSAITWSWNYQGTSAGRGLAVVMESKVSGGADEEDEEQHVCRHIHSVTNAYTLAHIHTCTHTHAHAHTHTHLQYLHLMSVIFMETHPLVLAIAETRLGMSLRPLASIVWCFWLHSFILIFVS